jgi:AcrR family transcriptional regulator
MVDAALASLREEGFAGTTARAVARRGGFNQALVYYHFGGLNELLLAALDASSGERLARYREAIEGAGSPQELVARARELFHEDVESGQATVVSELVGASLARPELAPEMVARMQPWVELARTTVERALADSPLRELLPADEVASAFIAFYLGKNLLARLDPATAHDDALFDLAEKLAPLFLADGA